MIDRIAWDRRLRKNAINRAAYARRVGRPVRQYGKWADEKERRSSPGYKAKRREWWARNAERLNAERRGER